MKRSSIVIVAVTALGFIGGAGGVALAERLAVPATVCRNTAGSNIVILPQGTIFASGTATVSCPVVVPGVATQVTDWDVAVRRQQATQVWDLKLVHCAPDGSNCSTSLITVPAGSQTQFLDGAALNIPINDGLVLLESAMPSGVLFQSFTVQHN